MCQLGFYLYTICLFPKGVSLMCNMLPPHKQCFGYLVIFGTFGAVLNKICFGHIWRSWFWSHLFISKRLSFICNVLPHTPNIVFVILVLSEDMNRKCSRPRTSVWDIIISWKTSFWPKFQLLLITFVVNFGGIEDVPSWNSKKDISKRTFPKRTLTFRNI